jgi:hypothetical protein
MSHDENTYELTIWRFNHPLHATKTISSIVPITEAGARAAAARKGWNVEGWMASSGTENVAVLPPEAPAPDGETLHLFAVTLLRIQRGEIEVEAVDEGEATRMALDQVHKVDWIEFDPAEVDEVRDDGLVEGT